MNPFEMVLGIVLIVLTARVIMTWLRTRAPAAPDPQQEARIARLEERVKALEAVVTDHGYDLKRQFREFEKQ